MLRATHLYASRPRVRYERHAARHGLARSILPIEVRRSSGAPRMVPGSDWNGEPRNDHRILRTVPYARSSGAWESRASTRSIGTKVGLGRGREAVGDVAGVSRCSPRARETSKAEVPMHRPDEFAKVESFVVAQCERPQYLP